MKKAYFFGLFLALLLIVSSSYSQNKIPTANQMLFSSAQGREFWMAVPPNEADGQPLGNTNDISIDFYVTSSKNCTVTLEIPSLDFKKVKKVEAFKVTTFRTSAGETSFTWEVRESEKVLNRGIHIYADQPISVYMLNHRNVTSDGLLCIPTSAWGTEYIHCAYYDFYENLAGGEARGGGFIITAAEDGTKCNIELKGIGSGIAQTWGGRNIPTSYSVTLNKGDIYEVMGDGKSRGVFDLTGSRVVASKPIGLISFHKRTLIPSYNLYNGRNNLMEMIPPVSAWGKKYYSVEFARKNHGDFFRLVASQPNTTYRVKWYDKITGQLISQRGPSVLKNSGDFFEWNNTEAPLSGNTLEGIRGTSYFEADKPILVMQYSYSTDYDNAPEFDPFMVLVVPEEQYISATVFQTPDQESGFLTNWFNIIAVGDTLDPNATKLRSIVLDGKKVVTWEPQFLYNHIPNSNLYWAKISVPVGPHRITSDTKFGGYIYGFSSADGYGWPAAMAINKIDEVDTLPPVLYRVGDCGMFSTKATEKRNGGLNDNPRQVDQGIVSIELMDSSFNFNLILPDPFITYPPLYETTYRLEVVDKTKDAYCVVIVADKYGNYTLDTVAYVADKISVSPNPINFGNVRLNTTKTLTVKLTNDADSVVLVKSIRLQKSNVFTIISGGAPPEFTLNPHQSVDVVISYTPVTESIAPDILDKDSLLVETRCVNWSIFVKGRGVIPRIIVDDWDAGSVRINTTACMVAQNGVGLRIQNPGSDTLIITGRVGDVAPFSLSSGFTPTFPIVIPPKGGTTLYDVNLNSPCFTPPATQKYSIDVTFNSNAEGPDSVSNWKGIGITPGPYISPYNFNRRRVNSINKDGVCYIKNSGNSPVKIIGVSLKDGTKGYTIDQANIVPKPSAGSPVDLQPETAQNGIKEIKVPVIFQPGTEGQLDDIIGVDLDPTEGFKPFDVSADLKGFGYLPKIQLTGYEFTPATLVGVQHPKTGQVVIKSTSTTADLFVDQVSWNRTAQAEFTWVNGNPPSKFVIPMGDSVVLPVTFKPTKVGKLTELVDVVNDAYPAPDSIKTDQTSVIGTGVTLGITVTDIDYGMVLTCDQPKKDFQISSTGSLDVTIYKVVLESGDISAFQIVSTFPDIITSNSSKSYSVIFTPNKVGNFSAIARVYASTDSAHTVKLTGVGYNVPIEISLRKYDGINPLIQPGTIITMDATLKNDKPVDAKITKFSFEILYESNWMKYTNKIDKGGALDNTWVVGANEVIVDSKMSKLVITGQGTTPIATTADLLVKPFFMVLLASNSFKPDIGNISVETRDACVTTKGFPGAVVVQSCVIDLRGVVFSGTTYALHDIDPNPISSPTFELNFDVGLKGETQVEIVNSNGQVVATICSGEKEVGKYSATISTSNLNSGLYFVRMVSGPYSEVKRLVIAK